MRAIARLVIAGMWCTAGLAGRSVLAQALPLEPSTGPPAVLDVPYLPQSVLLCGGAAIAMVERWWGRRGVYADDFAHLVRPPLGGILTTDLEETVRARGWDTHAFRGTPGLVRQALRDGIPVVALIEVAEARYHYVVVIGWTDGQVVYHDPAGAPFTAATEARFLARWARADHWALVIQPAATAGAATVRTDAKVGDPSPIDSMPCRPWLDRALDAAAANRMDEAVELLGESRRACPAEPVALRELAGVKFKQGRHAEAVGLAAEYVALVPGDSIGWQLLATTRFLTGDLDGALDAWNEIGRPTVDLVRIDGIRNIRFRTIADAMAVPHGTVLSSSRLALARRRVTDVPALRGAAVEYWPVSDGRIEVHVAVLERPKVERVWSLATAGVLRAIAQDEVGVEVATPTGAGELWTAHWRWESARPRIAFQVEMPLEVRFHGVVRIEGAWERFRFAPDSAEATAREETRRSAGIGLGGWVTAAVRPSATLRLDRWSEDRNYLTLSLGAEFRAQGNRFTLDAMVEQAVALSLHPSHTRWGADARWASSLGLGRPAWSARLGFDWVSPATPQGAWPIAGGNLAWAIPLRAHRATADGGLTGRSAGRGIMHAGLSGDHPVLHAGLLTIAVGTFLDGAEVIAPVAGSVRNRFYLDGGGGLRIGVADGQLGVLRIDLARGLLADPRWALTVGVHQGWPPR